MVIFVISDAKKKKQEKKSGKEQGWCGDVAELCTWSVRIS